MWSRFGHFAGPHLGNSYTMDKTNYQFKPHNKSTSLWHTVEKLQVVISAQLAVNYMYDMFTTTNTRVGNLLYYEEI